MEIPMILIRRESTIKDKTIGQYHQTHQNMVKGGNSMTKEAGETGGKKRASFTSVLTPSFKAPHSDSLSNTEFSFAIDKGQKAPWSNHSSKLSSSSFEEKRSPAGAKLSQGKKTAMMGKGAAQKARPLQPPVTILKYPGRGVFGKKRKSAEEYLVKAIVSIG